MTETGFRRVFLDQNLQAEFDRNGFVVVEDFLEPVQLERLASLGTQMPADVRPLPYSSTIMSGDLDYRERTYESVRSEFERRASGLLADYRVCYCAFIAKPAGDADGRGVVNMHQDPAFVDESQCFSIGIWCPLVDVDERNGCLRVVPGSHLLNRNPRSVMIPFPYSELLPSLREHYLQSIPMQAGQAFVYSSSLFHSSNPNTSNALRLVAAGLAIPRETPLLFFTEGLGEHAGDLAMYGVDDGYYQRHRFGVLPDENAFLRFVPNRFEPLTEETLQRRLRTARA